MWHELLVMAGLAAAQPIEWEHGWKTSYVVSTRMKNQGFEGIIKFDFPKQPHDSDRAETFDFISSHGCIITEGGGFPGAPIYTVCDGVKDRESANRFLIEFLPKLDKHMRSLR